MAQFGEKPCHVLIVELERLAHVHALISAMRMRSEKNCLTCKHKLQIHERESTFRILVRLNYAEKVVYITLRDKRGTYSATQTRIRKPSLLVTIYRSRGRL